MFEFAGARGADVAAPAAVDVIATATAAQIAGREAW
jgi:hypothetical protein